MQEYVGEGPEELEELQTDQDMPEESQVYSGSEPKSGYIHFHLSKRALISLLITVLIFGSGVAAWQLRWYQGVLDLYNTTSFTLRIKEGDKFAIAGAQVELAGATYTSDETGKVTIERVVAGDYQVKVVKDGYTPLEQAISIKRGDNDLLILSLVKTPEKLFKVTGLVRDHVSNQPLVDVQVSLDGASQRSNPSGEYQFDRLAAGDYSITLSKSGYHDKEQKITVASTDLVLEPLTLVPLGEVIFVSNRDGKRALYTSRYDGSEQAQFVEPKNDGEDFAPIISLDGNYVAFSSTRDGVKSTYGSTMARLYIAETDGQNLKKVSDDIAITNVRWAPGSKYLYYEGYQDTQLTTYVRRFYDLAKGSTFDVGEQASEVIFSQDGHSALYTVSQDGKSTLKLLNLATGERTLFAEKAVAYFRHLSFSADDASVQYEALIDQVTRRFDVRVSDRSEREIALRTPAEEREVTWSSDKKQAVFVEARDGKNDLFVVEAGGKNEKRLTTLGVVSSSVRPVWSENGQYVIFALQREGENALYIVAVAGGEPRKVTDFLQESSLQY